MSDILNDKALDILFREARSHNAWQDRDISGVTLQALYDLMRWGPTSMNCSPARFVFIKSDKAKERLKPHLMDGNVEKTMTAPVTVIIGRHVKFYDRIPELSPPMAKYRDWFARDEDAAFENGFRNGTLQGAYLIMAARALGLDCGPMSGFDQDGVNKEFFPDGDIKANFICALGYGDSSALHPRGPRLAFDDACEIL